MSEPLKPIAMRDAFLQRILAAMSTDDGVFFTCADFGSPVLDKIRAGFPERFVNVGVAEQNLINVSAGLALEGFTVFAYAIAPFITMRCYEQVRVSLALLSEVRPMNVNLIGVGAGYSYVVSGPTHQCYEDITLMRAMPNFRVLSPADHVSAAALFDGCVGTLGPKYLRFDAQVLPVVYEEAPPDVGRGFHVHRHGRRICLVATGYMLHTALKAATELAARGCEVGLIDLFDLARFDAAALHDALAPYAGIVTLEEGFRGRGGMDAMLFEFVARQALPAKVLNLGADGGYRFELGTRADLHEKVGIGLHAVVKSVSEFDESL
ncbi:transketolase C-terminal domain-containing protein [Trinickia caryophylli]|uniref:Transketolase n=1 Tax=Trinickia caryophylli TaxID=28094 RepID=A0A1X7CNT8_TRICW|nr:transketolase C-terminal domain-containing protein [Trinickia caryophylli]PMS11264.1 transketolase [Trinickia caryophylli]TRX20117.1 transketolase [Trinickia caryophylli]WQE12533.1 transketolase C-terminal domain-containing protein [Trinickia caryophylli]SME99905.1 transketolase [Trinickia caryophylli]GLU30218.1 transketolase [Trinickia caryophylli]